MDVYRFYPPVNDFVSMLVGFKCVFIYAVCHSSLAVPSQTKWNAIEDDFFFNLELGLDVLQSKYWLSPSM